MSLLDLLSDEFREPAALIMSLGGEEVADYYPLIQEATVEATRDKPTVATLRFESRRDENGGWPLLDERKFRPWTTIRLAAAFGSHEEEIMRGFVREVRAEYPQDPGTSTVTVECRDDSLALDREHIRRVWGAEAPTDDGAILREILMRHELSAHPECAAGQSGQPLSQDGTDVQFLTARARANGYELIFRDGSVYFGPMRLTADPQATITVYGGRDTNCTSFNVSSDGHGPDAVAYSVAPAQGTAAQKTIVRSDLPPLGSEPADSSESGLSDFTWYLVRQGAANEEELSVRAQQKANQLAMRVRAEGELDGSLYGHVLKVGGPVPVDGVGDWLGGLFYVDRVSHRFTPDGYTQAFTLLRNAYGDNLSSTSSVLAGIL